MCRLYNDVEIYYNHLTLLKENKKLFSSSERVKVNAGFQYIVSTN